MQAYLPPVQKRTCPSFSSVHSFFASSTVNDRLLLEQINSISSTLQLDIDGFARPMPAMYSTQLSTFYILAIQSATHLSM